MATYTKMYLTGQLGINNGLADGVPIDAFYNGVIHTSSSTPGVLDEVWLYAYNDTTTSRNLGIVLGVQFNSIDVPIGYVSLAPKETKMVFGGLLMSYDTYFGSTNLLKASSVSSSNIWLYGYVNRITP